MIITNNVLQYYNIVLHLVNQKRKNHDTKQTPFNTIKNSSYRSVNLYSCLPFSY